MEEPSRNGSRRAAQASYDRLSRWYDLLSGPAECRLTAEALAHLGVQAGESALEIGPGTGHALVTLARAVGPGGRVAGLDLSGGMLRVARERIRRAGLGGQVQLVQGDALALPFAAGSFTTLLLSFTLELLDGPAIGLALAECRRVLKVGGRIGVVALAPGSGAMVRLYEWAHRRFPTVIDCRPIAARAALEEAGFVVSRWKHRSLWGLDVEGGTGYRE